MLDMTVEDLIEKLQHMNQQAEVNVVEITEENEEVYLIIESQ